MHSMGPTTRSMTSDPIIADQTTMTTTTEPIYFWRTSEVPYGFMSQWYRSPFEVDGIVYETAEMWMMIQKAKLFGDEVRRSACRMKRLPDGLCRDAP